MTTTLDQSSELGQALKKSQLELSDSHAQCQHLALELRSLQEQLEEAQAAAEVASILNQELEEKETRIRQLKEEGMYYMGAVCVGHQY